MAADLWKTGKGNIAVVPSVNLGHSDEAGKKVKSGKGYVEQWVKGRDAKLGPKSIQWRDDPPYDVRCWREGEQVEGETRWPFDQI